MALIGVFAILIPFVVANFGPIPAAAKARRTARPYRRS